MNNDHIAELTEKLINADNPDKDSSRPLLYASHINFDAIDELVSELLPTMLRSNQKKAINQNQRCLRIVICSLIQAMFEHNWITLPTNPSNFNAEEGYLGKIGFTKRIMQRIIKVLMEEEWIVKGRGGFKNASGANKASQFFPTEKFIRTYTPALYADYGDFKSYDPVRFKSFASIDKPSVNHIRNTSKIITDYNSFMQEHLWAMRNPSTRAYKDFLGRSGRVNNKFQNIANRRVKLRSMTLIDGEPIAEPDFSCNHFRMFAYLVGEELPDDIYTALASETGYSRTIIKQVLTKTIGARQARQKGGLHSKYGAAKYRAIEAAAFRAYPWIAQHRLFFNDVGTRMQYLEGEIALRMMRWATINKIPLIAVHDSFAVKASDAEETEEQMHAVWHSVLRSAKRINYLSLTESQVAIVARRNEEDKALKRQ